MRLGNARLRIVVLLVLLAATLALRPAQAHAAWPIEGGARVVLGFGSSYDTCGDTRTHSGVDVAGEPGVAIASPVAGAVTFAGRVPGPDGTTVLAVTVESARGACTLLPLESVDVAKGASIAEGEALGSLAEGGDRSSSGAHVHVSLRKGGLYVDPTSLFGAAATGVQPEPSGSGASGSVPSAATPRHDVTRAPQPSTASAAGGSAARPQLRLAVPGAVIAPGVSVPSAQAAPAVTSPANSIERAPLPVSDAVSTPAGVPLAERVLHLAVRSSKASIAGAIGVLLGVGALWPLWRRDRRKGTGEVFVRAVGEDVAAAAGR